VGTKQYHHAAIYTTLLAAQLRRKSVMTKRFGLILVALLIGTALLSACSTESRDTAEDYVKAVFKGDTEKAQDLACSQSVQDETAQFISENITGRNVHDLDFKYDVGKGGNNEEIIVTGAFKVGPEDDSEEVVVAESLRDTDDVNNDGDEDETLETRIVLTMKKDGSDWCVEEFETNDLPLFVADTGAPANVEEPADAATEEAAPVATEEAAPAATEEAAE